MNLVPLPRPSSQRFSIDVAATNKRMLVPRLSGLLASLHLASLSFSWPMVEVEANAQAKLSVG
jgi:hypothetical protein